MIKTTIISVLVASQLIIANYYESENAKQRAKANKVLSYTIDKLNECRQESDEVECAYYDCLLYSTKTEQQCMEELVK